jgi:hypothetical protein
MVLKQMPAQSAADGRDSSTDLAAELDASLGDDVDVLHHRKVPNTRGDIDHVIIASSGVWVVDTKNYRGLVEQRDMGNWRTIDHRLYVNGRDRTEVVENFSWQIAAVRAILDPLGLGDVPIHPVLLFVGSGGRWFMKPIEIRGVRAMWAKKLIELVGEPGPLDATTRRTIATHLSVTLPEVPPATLDQELPQSIN